MRSIAERIIANYFRKNKIRYEIEQRVRGVGRPDFYLPDYDVYVEYWGLVKADSKYLRRRYVKTMRWKMAQYHSRKIKFISIYPYNLTNLDYFFRKKFTQVTGKKLPTLRTHTRVAQARQRIEKKVSRARLLERIRQNRERMTKKK